MFQVHNTNELHSVLDEVYLLDNSLNHSQAIDHVIINVCHLIDDQSFNESLTHKTFPFVLFSTNHFLSKEII
jgi:hypothetical protein